MSTESDDQIFEVLPKTGLLYTEQSVMPVLCKPKILPLKSVTLEKLERMQQESQEMLKQQEEESKLREQMIEQTEAVDSGNSGDGGGAPDVLTL